MSPSRQLAFQALRAVQGGAFADIALNRVLQAQSASLGLPDRRLLTELVYGTVRRQRTLDALIDQFAQKPAQQQPPDLRLILHLGLYQLRYLSQVPASAAVDTTVELAKANGLKGLAGFVNALLRKYLRQAEAQPNGDCLVLPADLVSRLGVQHSYPDWIVQLWIEQFGEAGAEQLCAWFNQPPAIDLRINPLQTSLEQVEAALQAVDLAPSRVLNLPQALRLPASAGAIQSLPGFAEGWWTVQDGSAQLVGHLLDPQPGDWVIDACAAPGGKTTHLAELMQDQGRIWAYDRYASRLKKLQENQTRLRFQSIQTFPEDSRQIKLTGVDRVLIDAPCSGLGTLHRHADARWRQTPDTVAELAQLQFELLAQAATWLKPAGLLVYATCTLHPSENEAVVRRFLQTFPDWRIDPPLSPHPAAAFVQPEGWLKLLPHQDHLDGFFMVRLLAPAPDGL
ncbi:MAG: 16S rRNA (cytosine(967)-C(5))-methyltransferase [Elainella sp.]